MADNNVPQVNVNATTKKRTIASELFDYSMKEVIIPGCKDVTRNAFTGLINMLSDAATKSIDKWIYPDGAPSKSNNNKSGVYTQQTNYTVYSSSQNQSSQSVISQRSSVDVDYIWVDTEEEAKYIISCLVEEIDNYGKAKVSTLYEKIKKPTTFTDFKFGWTNAKELSYRRDRGRWFIDLPRPINIENV